MAIKRIVVAYMEVLDLRLGPSGNREPPHPINDEIEVRRKGLMVLETMLPGRSHQCTLVARAPIGIAQHLNRHAMPRVHEYLGTTIK